MGKTGRTHEVAAAARFLTDVGYSPSPGRAYQQLRAGGVPGVFRAGNSWKIMPALFWAGLRAQAQRISVEAETEAVSDAVSST